MDICVARKKVRPLVRQYGIAKGKAAGFADGRASGFADGKADGVKEVAKALKENGMDIQEISKLTGLSQEEIENL